MPVGDAALREGMLCYSCCVVWDGSGKHTRAFLQTTDPPFFGTRNVWRSAAEEDVQRALLFDRSVLLKIAVEVEFCELRRDGVLRS